MWFDGDFHNHGIFSLFTMTYGANFGDGSTNGNFC